MLNSEQIKALVDNGATVKLEKLEKQKLEYGVAQ